MRIFVGKLPLIVLTASLMAGAGAANSAPAAPEKIAADNPYTSAFVSRDRPRIALNPDPNGPKIYSGKVKVEDYQRMLENGYDMLGYSSFEAGDVKPELALEHARAIKADLALLYTQVIGGTPMSIRLQQSREQARKDGADEDIALKEDQKRYSYFASYWVKLAPPLLGVHVQGPNANTEGLTVLAVVKQSPAAQARLETGDVLTRMGDVVLAKPEALTEATRRYAGQTVELELSRAGSNIKTNVTLNKPH